MKGVRVDDKLVYWLHLCNGNQFLIPFICQRCGRCCQAVFEHPCCYFILPNICSIYEQRPLGCRSYPVHTDFGTAGIKCEGYALANKAWRKLGQGISYWIGFAGGEKFEPSGNLPKAIAKLQRRDLPPEFIRKFIELNNGSYLCA